MAKRFFFVIVALACALPVAAFAQNSNSSATRQRTSTTTAKTPAQSVEEAGTPQATPTPTPRTSPAGRRAGRNDPSPRDVLAAFNSLIEGIKAANVDVVTGVYWNSPQLVLFNNNGTVTRGWDQMRKNRESSYPNLKDVNLEVRDVRTQMLGRDGAVVTALWTQSQTYKGTSETATGRMTLVFRRIGTAWKIVHLHTSPDAPDASRVLPSEQATPTPRATP
ncbi:MAG TPA: AtzH-like domain-containing protein [Pyrinomonadaceae bacterium]|nr:AtzH-like domain-containing protein [Pyrinomonadaceae bacterium]